MNKLKKIDEGYWFYPVNDFVYDKAYMDKYKEYVDTTIGKGILDARLRLISEYDKILDIGVGCGTLIDNKKDAKGFDVNPEAIKMLKKTKRWCDPYKDDMWDFDAITFFDSFEHIEKPELLLNRITHEAVVIVIPLFKTVKGILKSKHYRPDEHYHYFTGGGLIRYMSKHGFHCKSINSEETELGRDEIHSFVFTRN